MRRMKAERNSNIELLRIFAIMGVIVLHYNYNWAGGALAYVPKGSLNFYLVHILEAVFICAVDLFVLISGYFLSESKRRSLWKPVELIVQVMLFSPITHAVRAVVVEGVMITADSVKRSLIPANYFVILYSVVYIISPFLNVLFDNLIEKQKSEFIMWLVILFAIHPTILDVLNQISDLNWIGLSSIGNKGSLQGYSIVNFVLMYFIGAYLRSGNPPIVRWGTKKCILVFVSCIIILTMWSTVDGMSGIAWEYCNPVVILMAVLAFVLFSRIDLGKNILINKLAEGTFSVFLLHSAFVPYLDIERYVTGDTFFMMMHIVCSAAGIYILCWCFHNVYSMISKPILKKLYKIVRLYEIDLSE